MRWEVKQKEIINSGDMKIFKKFLILPLSINDETRWLEKVKYLAKARRMFDPTSGSEWITWEPLEWLE